MHVVLTISSLGGGGAERSLVNVAQALHYRGYQVSVITLGGRESDFYSLGQGVSRIALDMVIDSPSPLHALCNNLRRMAALRCTIRAIAPDVVVSFLSHMNVIVLLAMQGSPVPTIVVEQADPIVFDIGCWWHNLRRWTYPFAARLVTASTGLDHRFDWLSRNKRVVIYNSIADMNQLAGMGSKPIVECVARRNIVAMGRLAEEKGFDLLLRAFSQLAQRYPDWHLVILGEGEKRTELETLVKEYGLTEQVMLPGRISNPFSILKASDLFVLSSRSEGFGNALVEAMACGLPVISFDCPTGPREIIRDGIDGILVPSEDTVALAAAMDRLMSDKRERSRLAERAVEVTERFGLEKIVNQWEQLFQNVFSAR